MLSFCTRAFASDCSGLSGLKRPARTFLGALHEDKDIMSEMADFQEMSEVSSKPEKMWFNGWVWNLGSLSLPKPLQTTAPCGQSAKRKSAWHSNCQGEKKRERSDAGNKGASWWTKFFRNQVCLFVLTRNPGQLRGQGEIWDVACCVISAKILNLCWRDAFKQHLKNQTSCNQRGN